MRPSWTAPAAAPAWARGVVTALGRIDGQKVAAGVLDSRFFMGHLSAALGEKVTRLVEYADKNKLPLILFSASGGRPDAGGESLPDADGQDRRRHRALFGARRAVHLHLHPPPPPAASPPALPAWATSCLAEPGALIGFAGPRVIEQTIGEKLPEGFQTAEVPAGARLCGRIVPRARLRNTLIRLLKLHGKGGDSRGK